MTSFGDAFSVISQRGIVVSAHSSHQTIECAQKLNITWSFDEFVTNEVLDELFNGKYDGSPALYAVINCE